MNKGNWCYRCGRRIEVGAKICHHCGATQRKDKEPTNPQLWATMYDHLVFKAATEKLSKDEEQELIRLGEYLRNN